MSLADLFLSAFVALFVIADPVGTASIFAVLTRNMKNAQSRRIAVKAGVMATVILVIFGFVGTWLLNILGISVAAFRIAGGLLLFVTAFRMIVGFHDPDQLESEKSAYGKNSGNDDSIAVFPLAIPLLAGPGCMTAVVLHMTTASGDLSAKAIVILAVLLVQGLSILTMLGSSKVIRAVGETGSSLIARIMGILLAALSIQFVADGLKAIFEI
ncbi:MAG: marC integral membrane family protein [Micavibrio sp.]|nr:marC integral membrane family protein [Micavibrio sp.]